MYLVSTTAAAVVASVVVVAFFTIASFSSFILELMHG
jgi:hypothetical protein